MPRKGKRGREGGDSPVFDKLDEATLELTAMIPPAITVATAALFVPPPTVEEGAHTLLDELGH